MRSLWISIVLAVLCLGCSGFSEQCPEYNDRDALLQFLLDHKSSSKEADGNCVGRAFASLSHDEKYTEPLVNLLDFEQPVTTTVSLAGRGTRYPAINVLARSNFVPYLIKAIKESDSEIIRANAADTIELAYRSTQATVKLFEAEIAKPETTPEQKTRLEAEVRRIVERDDF